MNSNTSTTLNVYSHALKSTNKDAADKIGSLMFVQPQNNEKSNV